MQQNNMDIVRRVEEEHVTLRLLMKSVTDSFARPPGGDITDWKLNLVWELRDFRNALVKHFDLEEDGGFMGDVVATAPHEKRRVDQCEREHAEFLKEIDDITAELKRMIDPSAVQGVRERLDKLIEKLHDHEALECELLGTVYFQDFGTGD